MNANPPSTHGSDGSGRDGSGRFAPGNKLGRGNPLAGRVAKLRSVALEAVTYSDMRRIVRKLVELALAGDVAAAREVLSRVLGPVESIDLAERLDELEKQIEERGYYGGD